MAQPLLYELPDNDFSELILEVFGPRRGAHTRSAVGMAALPYDISVEIEAEIEPQ